MPDQLEQKVDELLATVRAIRPRVRRIAVQDGDSIKLLLSDDVVYATMNDDGNRLLVYTKDGKEYSNFSSVSELDELLADDLRFVRVHKSFLVNLDFVTGLKTVSGGRELSFEALPKTAIKVAQSNVKDVEAYFGIK